MVELKAADFELHARREQAFVLVARSRLLRMRLSRARRKSSWLMARTRFLMKTWYVSQRRKTTARLPGDIADTHRSRVTAPV